MTTDEAFLKHTKAVWLLGTVHGSDSAGGSIQGRISLLFTYMYQHVQDTFSVTLQTVSA